MRLRNQGLWWSVALLLAGVFLLLKNLGVIGYYGDAIWGGLIVATGAGFVIWFVVDRKQWWRAIPGFTLLSAGAVILLAWGNIRLIDDWRNALVLFGIALGFWAVLAVHPDNWWAAMPAGMLTVLGLLMGLQQVGLSKSAWLALLLVGLGLVFALVYLLRARWASVPAVALVLVGITTLTTESSAGQLVLRWWPVVLLAGSLGLLAGSLQRPPAPPKPVAKKRPAPPRPIGAEAPAAESAAPVTPPSAPESAPPAAEPSPAPAEGTPAEEKEIDIYELLSHQPPEKTPPADGPEPDSTLPSLPASGRQ